MTQYFYHLPFFFFLNIGFKFTYMYVDDRCDYGQGISLYVYKNVLLIYMNVM